MEKQFKFRAGTFTVGYQSCDDATAQQGGWATEKCTANARAYANDRSVLGVLGTFNSGCAKLEIPILNRAPGGGGDDVTGKHRGGADARGAVERPG